MNPQPPVLETGALAGLSYWPAEQRVQGGAFEAVLLLFLVFRMLTATRAELAAFELAAQLAARRAIIAAFTLGTF